MLRGPKLSTVSLILHLCGRSDMINGVYPFLVMCLGLFITPLGLLLRNKVVFDPMPSYYRCYASGFTLSEHYYEKVISPGDICLASEDLVEQETK